EDPGSSEAVTAKAVELGAALAGTDARKGQEREHPVLMGAVVRMATRKAVIPALQKGPGMEWILSSAIAQAATVEKPLIGVMQGHQEPSLQALDELAVQLNAQYDVEATAIYDSYPINERFASILIIDPKDSIPPLHQKRLDEYWRRATAWCWHIARWLPTWPFPRRHSSGISASHGGWRNTACGSDLA
ncbi:MAG: Gldg family protein, partial [Flavobacteriales bacterium]|nr:Gldg family protein [Flavobacteriales bacterium]